MNADGPFRGEVHLCDNEIRVYDPVWTVPWLPVTAGFVLREPNENPLTNLVVRLHCCHIGSYIAPALSGYSFVLVPVQTIETIRALGDSQQH